MVSFALFPFLFSIRYCFCVLSLLHLRGRLKLAAKDPVDRGHTDTKRIGQCDWSPFLRLLVSQLFQVVDLVPS